MKKTVQPDDKAKAMARRHTLIHKLAHIQLNSFHTPFSSHTLNPTHPNFLPLHRAYKP